ncbi:hypothetical protein MKW92_044091 [Papaver armeniacum]|nr:hypothetical protein MKW92_044091 [Papaver armeniacum]
MEDQSSSSVPSSLSSSPLPNTHLKTYELTASSISYTKFTSSSSTPNFLFKPCTTSSPPTYILRDISFTAYPSKSLPLTLPTHGSLFLNSTPLNSSSFRKLSAYVPQHDACLPLLTVLETFIFAAKLLIPDNSQISSVVDTLLSDLRLSHLANTRLSCGLSGGERRRVSIGLSLLHDPSVLLLDEPTSGLDSSSAFNVMQTLRSIVGSRHRTLILSIHQPNFKILSTIDSILLLSKGQVVHHGSISSLQSFLLTSGFAVPPQLNALEYAMEILSQLHENRTVTSPEEKDLKVQKIHEILTLYNRFWKIIYRTRQLLFTNTLEALIVGVVLGTIYIHVGYDKQGVDKRSGLFAFTLTFLLSSTTEALPIFINERPILLRETSTGLYSLSSHLIANTLVFLPYLLAIALVYSISVYFLVGLCSTWQAFSYFVLVIWIVLLMANSFVLFLSSLAPNYVAGTSLVTIFLGAFFSSPYWLFMHYLSMYKYALDALLINEYSCMVSRCLVWEDEVNKVCMMTGGDVLLKKELHERQRWINIYILIGFFVFYRVLCLLVLIRKASRSKK